jgi:hypothetical protein
MLKLIQADSEEYLPQARELLMEYAASSGFDLHFQEFKKELAEFLGECVPPGLGTPMPFLALAQKQLTLKSPRQEFDFSGDVN